jgi:protein phosphatase PTC1
LQLLEENKDIDPSEALRQAYLLTDKQMGETQIQFSGTTSISALVRNTNGKRMLYVANAGDARAVLCRNGKAERLSYDHKGSDEGETKRIIDAGGFVVLNRVNGILAVTRSLGDHAMKDYVIGEPHLVTITLDPTDTHLILACDGLWDVTSDQDAIDLILPESDSQKMSDKLLVHALKNGSTDNISVMVFLLLSPLLSPFPPFLPPFPLSFLPFLPFFLCLPFPPFFPPSKLIRYLLNRLYCFEWDGGGCVVVPVSRD